MPNSGEPASLPKVLRLWDVVLFLVTAGVNLQWVATAAAAGPGSLTVWILGCATMSLPLACVTINLASRFPQEGGLYLWTKRAFGDQAAFLAGWTYWMSNLPYLPGVLYFAAGNALYLGGERWRHLSTSPTYFILFSLAGLALATQMNLVGMRVGRWLSNLGAHARWISAAMLIGAGILAWTTNGSATEISTATLAPSLRFENLVFWSTIAFALTGLEAASFMGDEVENSRRTIPRAILIAVPVILVIYLLGTAALLVALPIGSVSGLQGIVEAATVLEQRLGLAGLTPVLAVCLVIHSLGSVGVWLGAVARLPFVAGIDRYLPPAFGRLHRTWGTPHIALLTQSAVTVLFVFLGQAGTTVKGAYEVLVSLMVVTYLIPFLFLFGAGAKLQFDASSSPGRSAAARSLLALLGALGFVTTAAAIVLGLFPAAEEPNKPLAIAKVAGMTGLMVVSGVVVFWTRSKAAARNAADEAPRPPIA